MVIISHHIRVCTDSLSHLPTTYPLVKRRTRLLRCVEVWMHEGTASETHYTVTQLLRDYHWYEELRC